MIEGTETSVSVEKSIHDKLEQERIAWDHYGPAWMGILKQIRREKDQRRHELLVIDRRKQKLSEWRKRLEQMQYDLTARESRILESESFLPLARQLQEMKLALEDALPWIETVKEWTQMQNTTKPNNQPSCNNESNFAWSACFISSISSVSRDLGQHGKVFSGTSP